MASKASKSSKNGSNSHGITINGNGEARFHGLEIAAVIPKARRGPGGFVFPVKMAEKFGRAGLAQQDIADILSVDLKTVQREFNQKKESEFVLAYKRGAANLRNSLRNKLLDVATSAVPSKGQVTALIFALKNYCGMADKQEVEHAGEVQVNVTMGGKAFKRPPKWLKEN